MDSRRIFGRSNGGINLVSLDGDDRREDVEFLEQTMIPSTNWWFALLFHVELVCDRKDILASQMVTLAWSLIEQTYLL